MMKSTARKRPWDKPLSRCKRTNFSTTKRHTADPVSNTNTHRNHDNDNCDPVMIDGVAFHSDRFYLNAPTGVLDYQSSPPFNFQSSASQHHQQQQQQPTPPLFDRSRLIQNLDLVGAIVATYTLDPEWLHREFPTLFPPPTSNQQHQSQHSDEMVDCYEKATNKVVPTLVLHGHRGLYTRIRNKQRLEGEQSVPRATITNNEDQKHQQRRKTIEMFPSLEIDQKALEEIDLGEKYEPLQNDDAWNHHCTGIERGKNTQIDVIEIDDESCDEIHVREEDTTTISQAKHCKLATNQNNADTKFENNIVQNERHRPKNNHFRSSGYRNRQRNPPRHLECPRLKLEKHQASHYQEPVFDSVSSSDDDNSDYGSDIAKNNSPHMLCKIDDEQGTKHCAMSSSSTFSRPCGTATFTPSVSPSFNHIDIPPKISRCSKDTRNLSGGKNANGKHHRNVEKKNFTSKEVNYRQQQPLFGPSVHLTEILSNWLPPLCDDTDGDDEKLLQDINNYNCNPKLPDYQLRDAEVLKKERSTVDRNILCKSNAMGESDGGIDFHKDEFLHGGQQCHEHKNHHKNNVIVIDSSEDEKEIEDEFFVKRNVFKSNYADTSRQIRSSLPNQTIQSSNNQTIKHPTLTEAEVLGVDENTASRRKPCVGVHHPKYMLLFERSGSIVVVVSTSNLTRTTATDASWIQRFEPISPHYDSDTFDNNCFQENINDNPDLDLELMEEMRIKCDGSDFGYILFDFLQRQSDAAREGQILPLQFIQKYVGWNHRFFGRHKGDMVVKSLDDIRRAFRFDRAQVHLISTVPGTYAGRFGCSHLGHRRSWKSDGRQDSTCGLKDLGSGESAAQNKMRKRTILYGPQRVADILSRLQKTQKLKRKKNRNDCNNHNSCGRIRRRNAWLPKEMLSQEDRLVMQTTSFGGNWRRDNFEKLVHLYLGNEKLSSKSKNESYNETTVSHSCDVLDRVDVVWPTQQFMNNVNSRSREAFRKAFSSPMPSRYNSKNDEKKEIPESFLFLSSKSFNSLDLSCISRMSIYEVKIPSPTPWILSPHIKTYARLICSGYSNENKCEQSGSKFYSSRDDLAWIMLTSACLTQGAQGKIAQNYGIENDDMSYSNFELGILFCSRIQGDSERDRLYTPYPKDRVCRMTNPTVHARLNRENKETRHYGERSYQPKIIPLPIPYNIRSSPYQADSDDPDFHVSPFFHEVLPESGASGQMTLTPLGKNLATKASGK